jgi:hypothetical protein
MVRRRALIRAGLVAATVGVAGCGSEGGTEGAGEGGATNDTTTVTGTGTATPTAASTAVDEYGTAPPVDETVDPDPVDTPRQQTTAADDDDGLDGPFGITSAVGTAIDQRRVGVVRLRLAAAEGVTVDTSTIRVRWLDPSGEYTVVASDSLEDADAYFGIRALTDRNDSAPVLDDPRDEFELVFDLGEQDVEIDDPRKAADKPGATKFASTLAEGSVVSIQLATGAGRSLTSRLQVPNRIGGESRVDIRVS